MPWRSQCRVVRTHPHLMLPCQDPVSWHPNRQGRHVSQGDGKGRHPRVQKSLALMSKGRGLMSKCRVPENRQASWCHQIQLILVLPNATPDIHVLCQGGCSRRRLRATCVARQNSRPPECWPWSFPHCGVIPNALAIVFKNAPWEARTPDLEVNSLTL